MAPCREQFSRRVTAHRYGNRPGLIPGSYRCLEGRFPECCRIEPGPIPDFRPVPGAIPFWLPGCAVGWL